MGYMIYRCKLGKVMDYLDLEPIDISINYEDIKIVGIVVLLLKELCYKRITIDILKMDIASLFERFLRRKLE